MGVGLIGAGNVATDKPSGHALAWPILKMGGIEVPAKKVWAVVQSSGSIIGVYERAIDAEDVREALDHTAKVEVVVYVPEQTPAFELIPEEKILIEALREKHYQPTFVANLISMRYFQGSEVLGSFEYREWSYWLKKSVEMFDVETERMEQDAD